MPNWNLSRPPGFEGLHPGKEITKYERRLPHWRQPGATYFVTFRLADSLPQTKLDELRDLRHDWEQKNPSPHHPKILEELHQLLARKTEAWLDQGMGSCHLRNSSLSKIVADAMHFFDGTRYLLGSFVIMPNHVHLVVRPNDNEDSALEDILQSWKRHCSLQINRVLQRSGTLWQEESFDRIVRNEEHLYQVLQYIGANPRKAKLADGEYRLWLRPDWEKAGWRFE